MTLELVERAPEPVHLYRRPPAPVAVLVRLWDEVDRLASAPPVVKPPAPGTERPGPAPASVRYPYD